MIEITTFASGSSGNLHLITSGATRILLECGLSFKKIMKHLKYDLNLAGCLLSHYHKDHSFAAHDLMKNGIPVFCTKETGENLGFDKNYLWPMVIPGMEFQIPDTNISCLPFHTNHDTPGSVGFLLQAGSEKIVFATDTGSLPYRFKELSYIMIECNYSEESITEENKFVINRTRKTHMSLQNVIDFLTNNDLSHLKEIHLIHLSGTNGDPVTFKEKIQAICGIPVYVS
jgi:Cft2 family RNA processing exonuclease